jgi:hypothetical protein
MAINRISGNILQDNLVRGSDLSIQGNLIYFDINNNRIGVRTSTPSDDFEVEGILRVGNVTIDSAANISAGNVNIVNLAEPVANSDAATKFYADNIAASSNIGNFRFTDNTISLSVSPANISIEPSADSLLIIDTNSGAVMPVGNVAQRPTGAPAGTLRFNLDSGFLEVYDGSGWDSLDTNFAITSQVITPDGTSDTFTLDRSTTAERVLISINGVAQVPSINYTVSGDQLTMVEIPLSTDIIDVRFISPAPASGTVDAGTQNRLAYYANTGSSVRDSGANLTWNGTDRLDVAGNVAITGAFLQVPTYANATARDSAISVPAAGMIVLVGNIFTGYNGSSWANLSS